MSLREYTTHTRSAVETAAKSNLGRSKQGRALYVFKILLGAESKLNKENEEITIIIEGLHHPTGPYSIPELERAKSKIVEGKAAGPDNIPPEVIKRCDLDDIRTGLCQ